jgi:hypothetical protein
MNTGHAASRPPNTDYEILYIILPEQTADLPLIGTLIDYQAQLEHHRSQQFPYRKKYLYRRQ